MTTSSRLCGLALGLAGAMALASPTFAAPVFSSAAGVKAAASDNVIDVRLRRGSRIGAGIAAGVLAGAAFGALTAPRYSYGLGYGYPYGAYAYDEPVYGGPVFGAYGSSYAYPYQTCGAYGGYGRWDYAQC